jgi:predicted  nucleic acid-binding Zn-ribbon protein
LKAERDQAASGVPPKALDFFNRVAGKNEGVAMAKVIRTHPKRAEYACDGCNMAINIEQVNAILSRDEAVTCNICGKILYVDAPAAKKHSRPQSRFSTTMFRPKGRTR